MEKIRRLNTESNVRLHHIAPFLPRDRTISYGIGTVDIGR